MSAVVYGANYCLYCIGIGCMLNCPLVDQQCPAWVSGKTITINSLNFTAPSMSTFDSALAVSFLPLGANASVGSPVTYQTPMGIATYSSTPIPDGSGSTETINPAYLSMQQFSFQNDASQSEVPNVIWNVCNKSQGGESDNWAGGNKNCFLPSKSFNAFNDLIDQWILIPGRTVEQSANNGQVNLGDVFAITTTPQSQNLIPSAEYPQITSMPIGVFTNNSSDLLSDLQSTSPDNYTGIIQPIQINDLVLNIINNAQNEGDSIAPLMNPLQWCPTTPSVETTTFYFMITDQNGSIGSVPLQPPLYYNCPCSITSCSLCNVPGQLAFLDPISGQKCPVTCSQTTPGGPCTFQLISGSCPACNANNCTPACGIGQVCERNLSTGACECVNIPSQKNKVIWLIVIISVILLIAVILIILLIVRNRKEKKAAEAFQKSLIQGILQNPAS